MSELSEAINEMRNMRESYDQLAATADLYQQGRTALASAITAKGVPTTADTPLADMAENIDDIQQETTILQGGDVYAQQLFGDADAAVSPLWNLYDVLAQMKSRFMGAGQYAALIVCEYYKGYDSLQLQGADAYYTCDGDFYDISSPLHTWHDSDNGKANRWVCFLFATEGARFDITNTAISPRSMYIGGHIGTIEYFVNGRLTSLVGGVEDTDFVDNFICGKNDSIVAYTQSFAFNTIIRNVKKFNNNTISGITFSNEGAVIICGTDVLDGGIKNNQSSFIINCPNASYLYVDATEISGTGGPNIQGNKLVNIILPRCQYGWSINWAFILVKGNLQRIYAPSFVGTKSNTLFIYAGSGESKNLNDVTVGAMNVNLNMGTWNPTNVLADADKKAQLIDNIKNHILARVSDRTGLSQLVFTISTNMYNNIASEQIEWQGETMTLADAFLTKNWLLAGA